jgi:hypothetical protein
MPASSRRAHQDRVAGRHDPHAERRGRLELLRAAGVRPAGLRDLQQEIDTTARGLGETVAGAGMAG